MFLFSTSLDIHLIIPRLQSIGSETLGQLSQRGNDRNSSKLWNAKND
jgi:hypothetical protein